ncbi:MAG: calcium/sodium antiporter [Acidimicrobiales bacterium]
MGWCLASSFVVGAELLVQAAAISVWPGSTCRRRTDGGRFGTSAPELAVSVGAGLAGNTDVAFGNVAGSNIINILLILGASALVGGLAVSQRIVKLDVPILIGVTLVTFVMALDNRIGRVDGSLLFLGVRLYTWWLIRASRRETAAVAQEYEDAIDSVEARTGDRPLIVQLGFVVAGVAILILGSQLMVGAATDIATSLGVSDLIIGLTVVAVGTSLPEFATSMMAAFRGQRDLAVGNIIGSNLFNLMCVLGATGIVSGGVNVSDASLRLDFPVMIFATVVLLPIVWAGFCITRWQGLVLGAFYLMYVAYLILDENGSTAIGVFRSIAVVAAVLTLAAFSLAGVRGWRQHRAITAPTP